MVKHLITLILLLFVGSVFGQRVLLTRLERPDTSYAERDNFIMITDTAGIPRYFHKDSIDWGVAAGVTDLTIGGSGPTYIVESSTGTDVTISAAGATTLSEPSANELRVTTTNIALSNLANIAGLSIPGRATNSTGAMAAITAGTENHVLRRSGNVLQFGTISDASIADLAWSKITSTPTTLSGYGITDGGGTDNQKIDTFELDGTDLLLSIEGDGEPAQVVDLSSLQDGTGTDDQNLSIGGSGPAYIIEIEGGDDVTISAAGATTLSNPSANELRITSTDTQLTEEEVEDFVGGMVTGNTETRITVTYEDSDGTLDFVVEPNLSAYTNNVGFITGNQTITLSGDVTGSGTTAITTTIATGAVGADELASTAVTPGSYTLSNITVDADGRITAASNGTDAAANLTIGGSGPTYIIESSTGTDVTISAAGNIALSEPNANELRFTGSGLTGSGTADRIAYWNTTSTLASHPWEITSTYIRGTATGWPQMQNGGFVFRGATSTGMILSDTLEPNILGIHAGDATNPAIEIFGGGLSTIYIDPDDNGIKDWVFFSTGAGNNVTTGYPYINYSATGQAQYSFHADTDTGLKRSAADVIGIYAGDATNPHIQCDGPGALITFDPDDDGTPEVTISATTMTTELLDIGAYGTTATKLAGLNASGVVTEVTLSGMSLISDVLTATDVSATNEIQQIDTFTIVSNVLRASLSSDDVPFKSVDLSPYLDNTDDQKIDTFAIVSNILRVSNEGDGEPFKSVDLSPYLDNTDDQTISLDSTATWYTLNIESGNSVNFVKGITGNQTITLSGDVTGSGTTAIATTIATGAVGADELASTAVTPGSYTLSNITVDADGRITAASNGTDAAANLTIGGSGPTYIIESSTGTDVTISAAGNIALSEPNANELRFTGSGLTGSGTADRIAYWNTTSTLASHPWEITSTYIRGTATGWPQMQNGGFVFRGATSTGMFLSDPLEPNTLGIHAGDATNPAIEIFGGGISTIYIDPDDNGIKDWVFFSTGAGNNVTTGYPYMTFAGMQYGFHGDTDTGLKRSAADVIGIYAGDATNPHIQCDGPGALITFDPDDDGTPEVTISATTMTTELLDIGAYGTTATKLAGLNASGVVTEVGIGELVITSDVLSAPKHYAEMYVNGTVDLTATSETTFDFAGGSVIETSGLDADIANDWINPTFTGVVLVTFTTELRNETGSNYTGSVTMKLYKNGAYANKAWGVKQIANDESKILSFSTLLTVTPNDEITIKYVLSSDLTIKASIPTLTVTQVN